LPKIRALQICDHLGWEGSRMHGVKRLFAWMIPRFDPSRFEVSLLSLRKKDLSEDNLESLGFPVYYLEKGKFDPSTLPALISLLSKLEIQVVQTHGYGATTFGRIAARWLRIGNVLHEHANLTDTPWFQKIPDRLLNPVTDVAIAVSESTREFCIRARKLSPERVKKVYLGAPLDEFAPFSPEARRTARERLGFGPEEKIVGTVTRLMESKGNHYLVEAASILARKRSDVRIAIVGEGPLGSELQGQARDLGISGRVSFLGFQRDVAPAIAAFDVSVFPSLWEGTPLTVFEAMAMKKPIVATNVDGLRDVLADGDNALVVPPKDAGALARALERVLDEPGLAPRLSESARESSRRFDIRTFVRKMERLYELLVDRYRASGGRPRWDYGKDFAFLEDGEESGLSSLREARAVSS
jgi:glycosyltransferase involved in cell wall biosynthesis